MWKMLLHLNQNLMMMTSVLIIFHAGYFSVLIMFIQLICRRSVKNSVNPDQLAFQKSADLDLHCFQNKIYAGLAW